MESDEAMKKGKNSPISLSYKTNPPGKLTSMKPVKFCEGVMERTQADVG